MLLRKRVVDVVTVASVVEVLCKSVVDIVVDMVSSVELIKVRGSVAIVRSCRCCCWWFC
jgi:hypothetical protein